MENKRLKIYIDEKFQTDRFKKMVRKMSTTNGTKDMSINEDFR